jgi:hypothetical protein
MMADNATATNDPGQVPPKAKCTKSVHPNMMHFEDAEGVVHEIHMPRERYFEAHKLFEKEDWEALKKFDKWSKFPSLRRLYQLLNLASISAGQEYQPHEILASEDELAETVANATENPSDEAIEKPKPNHV